jgi:hypothetical protein
MKQQQLIEIIRRVIKRELNEEKSVSNPNAGKWRIVSIESGAPLTKEFYKSKEDAQAAAKELGRIKSSGIKYVQLKDTMKVSENAPAPSKPKPSPSTKPTVAPGKPGQKPGPRRPLGNPNVKPAPKATMNEAEMLAKIIKRFKSKKKANEGIDDISMGVEPYSRFKSADELINSISGRLITASQMQDWNLVDEIATDVFNFTKNK